MPTGYTADIAKGIGFKEFIMGCARAFGALIEMKNSPADAEIPEDFEPSLFYKEHLAEAKEEFEYLKAMTPAKAKLEAEKEYKEEIQRRGKKIKKDAVLQKKYEEMLSEVRAWQPPTPDHVGLKEFMEKQIQESVEWDCGASKWDEERPAKIKTGTEWLQEQINSTLENMKRYEEEWQKEQNRARERTAWVKALRKSLEVS